VVGKYYYISKLAIEIYLHKLCNNNISLKVYRLMTVSAQNRFLYAIILYRWSQILHIQDLLQSLTQRRATLDCYRCTSFFIRVLFYFLGHYNPHSHRCPRTYASMWHARIIKCINRIRWAENWNDDSGFCRYCRRHRLSIKTLPGTTCQRRAAESGLSSAWYDESTPIYCRFKPPFTHTQGS